MTDNTLSVKGGLHGQHVKLIHSAILEFVTTNCADDHGLYPLLNQIILLVQKPVLLIVFNKPLADILKDPKQGWDLSLPYIHYGKKGIRQELIDEVVAHFGESEKARWIVEVDTGQIEDDAREKTVANQVYGLGILYLRTDFVPDGHHLDSGLALEVERCDEKMTQLFPSEDVDPVRELFSSIIEHPSDVISAYRPHIHHIASYWVHARDEMQTINADGKHITRSAFEREHEYESNVNALTPSDLRKLYKPVFEEIDALYCDLRGGVPGTFEDFVSRTEAGVPLLWSRHRESTELLLRQGGDGDESKESLLRRIRKGGDGVRPPTIAFYMQLRSPANTKRGYRIVPVVTRSMCLDLAATLVDHRNRHGDSAEEQIERYLKMMQVNVDNCDYLKVEDIADKLEEALHIERFLGDTAFHSMTYPAFSSGLVSILTAKPCSITDHFAFGPDDFLTDNNDTAYIAPVSVSGSAFAAVMTKSRTPLDLKDKPSFDACYYNYIFHQSVLSRLATRLRRAVRNTYFDQIHSEVFMTLTTKGFGVKISPSGPEGRHHIKVFPKWVECVNKRLERLAQAFPYAMVQITGSPEKAAELQAKTLLAPYREKDHTVAGLQPEPDAVPNVWLGFYLARNNYYGRKFVDADGRFISVAGLKKSIDAALKNARHYWQSVGVLKSRDRDPSGETIC